MFDSTVGGSGAFPALLARQKLDDRDTEDVAQLKKCRTIWRLRTPSLRKCGRKKKLKCGTLPKGLSRI
jgi:hypothetical protein